MVQLLMVLYNLIIDLEAPGSKKIEVVLIMESHLDQQGTGLKCMSYQLEVWVVPG